MIKLFIKDGAGKIIPLKHALVYEREIKGMPVLRFRDIIRHDEWWELFKKNLIAIGPKDVGQ